MGRYLFIDGAFLIKAVENVMYSYAGQRPDLAYEEQFLNHLKRSSEPPDKVFWYDAQPSEPDDDEDQDAFKARSEKKRNELDTINSHHFCQVREGSLKRRRKRPKEGRKQKGVDVLLAVEALGHVFRKNAKHVHIVAGDADYLPLVDELVQFGALVTLFYVRGCSSKTLIGAADDSEAITFEQLHRLAHLTFRQAYPSPRKTPLADGVPPECRSDVKGPEALLVHHSWAQHYILRLPGGFAYKCTHSDLEVQRQRLEAFAEHETGVLPTMSTQRDKAVFRA